MDEVADHRSNRSTESSCIPRDDNDAVIHQRRRIGAHATRHIRWPSLCNSVSSVPRWLMELKRRTPQRHRGHRSCTEKNSELGHYPRGQYSLPSIQSNDCSATYAFPNACWRLYKRTGIIERAGVATSLLENQCIARLN